MIIVCDNTDIAEHFHRMISGEETYRGRMTPEEDDEDDDAQDGRRSRSRRNITERGFPVLKSCGIAKARKLRCASIRLLSAAESEDPKRPREGSGGGATEDCVNRRAGLVNRANAFAVW